MRLQRNMVIYLNYTAVLQRELLRGAQWQKCGAVELNKEV